ncbi:MAG TPA: tRNA (guanosine(37)-N1)-methyltransferase TrmD [Chloroflexota bacterium]|nr:tRNA (guanosine(37)-N1)-methyltransferase TrmD [Chloroflexota bacterium]
MRIAIFTLFPDMFAGPFGASIVGRAVAREQVAITLHNFRDMATDRHHTVDDYPYGGGAGMVLRPDPLFASVEAAALPPDAPVILLTPQGRRFDQCMAARLAALPAMALICGHYEGVDERVRVYLATEELSLGDYVLSGGEIAAMAVVDAVVRLLPGVIDPLSLEEESHHAALLEYPHYTRPAEFRGWATPDVLISGNHAAIARWRREQSLRRTWERRPDLLAAELARDTLSPKERQLIAGWDEARADPAAANAPAEVIHFPVDK